MNPDRFSPGLAVTSPTRIVFWEKADPRTERQSRIANRQEVLPIFILFSRWFYVIVVVFADFHHDSLFPVIIDVFKK
jgi:hypothetical protein